MSHQRGRIRPSIRTREAMPQMRQTPDGVQLLCPFCTPTHPLLPGQPAVCGTELRLTAVQMVVPARVAKMNKITCLKCHKTGEGEMVKYMSGFIHVQNCTPGTRLLPEMPKFSTSAKLVFKLPIPLRRKVEKATGRAEQVREIDQDGKETGKILGYFFMKGADHDATRATPEPSS